ncbi:hypothetical protein HK100_009147 [Physocladia obscura]|uniref:Swollenin n=1 Tax=Physocladia obscura TaxID=109957 RepID=A0AAD5T6B8_9FUNG|nr:hypothetical protein HK100_009147 [Physocladia obscura]
MGVTLTALIFQISSLAAIGVLAQSCASLYGQCGGSGWTGPTCCVAGSVCTPQNGGTYYYQCLVGSSASTTTSSFTKSSTTAAPATSATSTATTVTTSAVASSVTANCSAAYGQCGGVGWTGAVCCPSGFACFQQGTNQYFYQCLPGTTTTTIATSTNSTTSTTPARTGTYTTSTTFGAATRTQGQYPTPTSNVCGSWQLSPDNVCLPLYCSNNNESTDCSGCGGSNSTLCTTPVSETGKSGDIYNITTNVVNEGWWHYSRSTHYGITTAGACGFGLYGVCSTAFDQSAYEDQLKWGNGTCSAFCKAYPNLCADPAGTTLRGNFAAPNGNYYTQFKANLPDNAGNDLDNYVSCGECFQLVKTKADGTDYAPAESGYAAPITFEVTDSCPCEDNSKWCCGPGSDHCGEVSDFKYGCPLPEGSWHFDLGDFAMARLQTGAPNGTIVAGLIPTRFQRVPCPNPGNVYIWLHTGTGPYYFMITVVNTAGNGGVVLVELSDNHGASWTPMIQDAGHVVQRPQDRYGAWVYQSTATNGLRPLTGGLPIGVRITSAAGEQIVNTNAITTFTAPAGLDPENYFIDIGAQFTK